MLATNRVFNVVELIRFCMQQRGQKHIKFAIKLLVVLKLGQVLCKNYLGSNNSNLYHVYLESLHLQTLIMEEM